MTNSADPDQLASSETDLDLHCLLKQGMSCSAREGLNLQLSIIAASDLKKKKKTTTTTKKKKKKTDWQTV